jgi:hypothetical protein
MGKEDAATMTETLRLARDALVKMTDPQVSFTEAYEARKEALAAIDKELAKSVCPTCDGRGEIGGFVGSPGSGAEGYQTDRCPDCGGTDETNEQRAQALAKRLRGGPDV